jgi:hypothetical protein
VLRSRSVVASPVVEAASANPPGLVHSSARSPFPPLLRTTIPLLDLEIITTIIISVKLLDLSLVSLPHRQTVKKQNNLTCSIDDFSATSSC